MQSVFAWALSCFDASAIARELTRPARRRRFAPLFPLPHHRLDTPLFPPALAYTLERACAIGGASKFAILLDFDKYNHHVFFASEIFPSAALIRIA